MGRVRRNKAHLRSRHLLSPVQPETHPSVSPMEMEVFVYPGDASRRRQARHRRVKQQTHNLKRIILSCLVLGGIVMFWPNNPDAIYPDADELIAELAEQQSWPALEMTGGDPYIRALMRTISASESNYVKPYNVLYGGQVLTDLSHHPDRCVRIVAGPNTGQCTTAAGRYQILTPTWELIAKWYHPQASPSRPKKSYSFEPRYQDQVVYRWLLDQKFWEMDIATTLKDGDLEVVLDKLSGTWTSLGYGIEDNVMTDQLPEVYYEVLIEELETAGYTPEDIEQQLSPG